jgi:hypothetical protein
MSFRDVEQVESSNDRRTTNVVKMVRDRGLPEGFVWVASVTSSGDPTLNIVHVESDRTVFYGD